jgi:hypothetical protein
VCSPAGWYIERVPNRLHRPGPKPTRKRNPRMSNTDTTAIIVATVGKIALDC